MAELHFCRLRKKDSNDEFLDPEADIKELMPKAFAVAEKHTGNYISEGDQIYFHNVIKVLETKILEDPAPLEEQLKQFRDAVDKLPKNVFTAFMRTVGMYLMACWMLHLRRDGQADKKGPRFAREAEALSLYGDMSTVVDYVVPPVTEVDAVCVETDEVFHNIKDTATITVGASPRTSWEEAAAACDKYLETDPKDVEKVVAASLAYPTYEGPYFEVAVDADTGKD